MDIDAAGTPAAGEPPATAPRPSRRSRLPTPLEVLAVLIPVVAVIALVLLKPSALLTPDLYFVYALLQGIVFLLVIRFLDLYEREPIWLLALMAAWGAVFAGGLSLIGNGLVASLLSRDVGATLGAAIEAPLVEETAKGMALVAAFGISSWANRRYGWLEFEGVTDGVVYGAAVGLGFALSEDIFYFFKYLDVSVDEALKVYVQRVDFFGAGMLGHSLYTAAFGAGLGFATWSATRAARIGWPLLGLCVAMLLHGFWNGAGALFVWVRHGWDEAVLLGQCYDDQSKCATVPDEVESTAGWGQLTAWVVFYAALVLLAVTVAFWLRYQRRVIRQELGSEVESGLVSREDARLISRYFERTRAYWRLVRARRFEQWYARRRLDNELVHLAFAKWRVRRMGGAAPGLVERHRARVRYLADQHAAAMSLEAGV